MASISINIKNYQTDLPGKVSQDGLQYDFPEILSTNSHGKQQYWRIYIKAFVPTNTLTSSPTFVPVGLLLENKPLDPKEYPMGLYGWIKVASGQVGGKEREVVPTIVHEGKNLGKANATNVFCQALRDAFSLYNKQLKKSADSAPITGPPRYPPMLAKLLKDRKTPIDYNRPIFLQRKFNGVRMVATYDSAEGTVILYSRRKQTYPGFGYLRTELLPILKTYWDSGKQLYLDGEVYKHGLPLQQISGIARREDKGAEEELNYYIYDIFFTNNTNLKFSARSAELAKIFTDFGPFSHLKQVETFMVKTPDGVQAFYQQFLSEGYEGAMLRLDEPYKYSIHEYHSDRLLKLKPTLDAEYEVINWTTGEKGKAAEALMIVCKTLTGQEFPVTPALEIQERVNLAKKMEDINPATGQTFFQENYLGKKIRIYFDEYSVDKVPQRARTKLERMGIDIIQ